MMSLHCTYDDVICSGVVCSGQSGRADWTDTAVLSRGSALAGCMDLACCSGLGGGADPACPLAVAGGADPAGGADRAQAGWSGGAGSAVSAYPGIHLRTSARKGTSHSSWQSTPRPDASTRWMSMYEG